MAGIDKTYCSNYTEYKEFKDWADKQIVVFFDYHVEYVGKWVWEYEENDFSNGEVPIMNTPTWLDIYLIQNCKSQLVLDRMKEVYGKDFEIYKNLKKPYKLPEDYKQNRKIVIKSAKNCKFPFKRKMFNKPIKAKSTWWLQCNDDFWYNDETKKWVGGDLIYPHNTNTSTHKTTKSLIRFLRKQYLPKGITFRLIGNYIGEDYVIKIK